MTIFFDSLACNMIFSGVFFIIYRTLTVPLRRASLSGEPILLQGPRGSGKTTLLRSSFPAHSYVTLEDPAERDRARRDPQAFLGRLRGPALIDDVHRAPQLMVYMDGLRPLILGSSLRLQTQLTTFELYPATLAEREGRRPLPLEMLGRFEPAPVQRGRQPAPTFAPGRAWLDRDVRALINVHDLDRFEEFVRFAETCSAGVLDQQGIADACGLSHRTVARWLGVLDTCFRTLRLPASTLDFGRRLVRSPKLHFLESDALESRAVGEIYKNARHSGMVPNLSYWRDSNGFEMPLLIETENAPVVPVSIAREPNPLEVEKLRRWMDLAGVSQGAIIAERGGRLPRKGILSYSTGQL